MTKLSEINRARQIAGLPLLEDERITAIRKLAGIPAKEEATLTEAVPLNEAAVKAAAEAVIEMAAAKAERANGEVDADGVDDFLDVCLREFGVAVLAKAKELNV